MSLKEARARLAAEMICQFAVVYRQLDDEDKETFNQWVGEHQTPHWMYTACRVDGVKVAEKTMRKHLQGWCNCPPETELKGVYSVAA